MNRFLAHLIISVLAIFLFTGCDITTGEGPIVEKGFATDSFHKVELDGSFDVEINQGAMQNVIVAGNENIIDKLRMQVIDEMLYLSLEPGNYLNYDLLVKLTVTDLSEVRLMGSGDVKLGTFVNLDQITVFLDGSGDIKSSGVLETTGLLDIALDGSGDIDLKLKSDNVRAELQGSGDMDLEGTASTFDATLDGSGDIKAYSLETVKCNATLEGSGSIHLFVTSYLKASLDGSGDITYKGEPKVEAQIDGSGSVSAH